MEEIINISLFGDALMVGAMGFVVGVLVPLGFRLVGYVVDSAKIVLEG